MTMIKTRKRLSFDLSELDDMVGGGLLKGSSNLISGAPGIGKTTIGIQFLVAGIKENQPGLLVSFEEFPASLIKDAFQLGWDLRAMEKEGLLKIIFTSPEVFLSSLKSEESPLSETLRVLAPQRVVIDSIAHLKRITNNPLKLRELYNTMINAMKREHITSLLLDEAVNVLKSERREISSLPFVVDTIILMRYVEVDSSIQRAIAIMKMRGSTHQKSIRRFEIEQGGLKIGDAFSNREGILSGLAHRIG